MEIKVFHQEGKPSIELRKEGDEYIMAQLSDPVKITKEEYEKTQKMLTSEGYRCLTDVE